MSTDPTIRGMVRETRRARRLPPGATCTTCQATEHLSRSSDGSIRCYAHLETTALRELDHVAGRANLGGLLVPLTPNAHRKVTDIRLLLGKDGWPIANGDPLLAAGHAVAGLASLLWLLAEWLIQLGQWLSDGLGPRWWTTAPLMPLAT